MKLMRRHGMTKDVAKEWVDGQLSELLNRFGSSVQDAQHHWEGDVMQFSFAIRLAGRIQGTLRVDDTDYTVDVPLGFRQRLFEGRARAVIERWLDENLVCPG